MNNKRDFKDQFYKKIKIKIIVPFFKLLVTPILIIK